MTTFMCSLHSAELPSERVTTSFRVEPWRSKLESHTEIGSAHQIVKVGSTALVPFGYSQIRTASILKSGIYLDYDPVA